MSAKQISLRALIAFAGILGMGNAGMAQEVPLPPPTDQSVPAPVQQPTSQPPSGQVKEAHQPTAGERRRAAKLYMSAAKLYEQERFEDALRNDQQAAALDPGNENYRMAVEIARSHAVAALIQAAAKSRLQGDAVAARSALEHAYQLDPSSPPACTASWRIRSERARK